MSTGSMFSASKSVSEFITPAQLRSATRYTSVSEKLPQEKGDISNITNFNFRAL